MRIMMLIGGSTTIAGTILVVAVLLNATTDRSAATAADQIHFMAIPAAHVQAD